MFYLKIPIFLFIIWFEFVGLFCCFHDNVVIIFFILLLPHLTTQTSKTCILNFRLLATLFWQGNGLNEPSSCTIKSIAVEKGTSDYKYKLSRILRVFFSCRLLAIVLNRNNTLCSSQGWQAKNSKNSRRFILVIWSPLKINEKYKDLRNLSCY